MFNSRNQRRRSECLLLGDKRTAALERRPPPDWPALHRELRRPGVNIPLEFGRGNLKKVRIFRQGSIQYGRSWVSILKMTRQR